MRLLCVLLASTTVCASAFAWHYRDMATKWRHLSEETADMLNALLLNQAADVLERERVS